VLADIVDAAAVDVVVVGRNAVDVDAEY